MSYSFKVRGTTKAEALEKVGAEFDKVVVSQPVHSADRAQAQAAANAFVGLIPDPSANQVVDVSVNGWVSWENVSGSDTPLVKAASVSVSASLGAKE